MGAGEHLDVLGERGVPGDRAVMGPVEADQLGQHVRIAGVALGAGGAVPLPIAGHLPGIDRVDGVAGGDQRLHPRPAVGLDAHDDLVGLGVLLEMVGDQRVQRGQPLHTLGQPPSGQSPAGLVDELDVVMGLGPVVSQVQHRVSDLLRVGTSCVRPWRRRPWRPNGSVLEARHPTGHPLLLTNRRGHGLKLGLENRTRDTECSPAGGSDIRILLQTHRMQPH
jgi:hypothetical protein